jgi:NitT/TauT family transport system substrate-binding protein
LEPGEKMNKLLLSSLLFVLILTSCNTTPAATPTNAPVITEQPKDLTEVPTQEPTPYEPATIKINSSKLLSYAPIFIAEKEGYFEDYGITLEYVPFSRPIEAIPLLAVGDVDVYAGSINAGILNTLLQESNIKIVADRGSIKPNDCTYGAILVRKELYDNGTITKPEDLKGQVVVASQALTTGYLVSKYLATAGLTLDDVELSDLPSTSFIDGLANKSVAAISTNEPSITRVMKSGEVVMLTKLEEYGPFQISVLAFGKNLLIDRPDIGARFLAAYLKGIKSYNEGKTERNIQILADSTGEDLDVIKDSCWIPIREDGKIDFQSVEAIQNYYLEQKLLQTPVSEGQFWDQSFLTAANELLK